MTASSPRVLGPGTTVVRSRRFSLRWRRRHAATTAALAGLVLLMLAASLVTGSYTVTAADAWNTLWGSPPSRRTDFFVMERRLPRALVALTVGACLAISGALFQRLTRNALASPDVIGVSGGAAVGAVVVVVNHGSPEQTSLGAFTGAVVAAALLMLAITRGGLGGHRMVLVGVAVAAFCGGLVDHLLNGAYLPSASSAQSWVVGSLQGRSWPELQPVAIGLAVALPVLVAIGPRLRVLGLGDETAAGLGVRVRGLRWTALLVATLLCAVAVSVSGPIAFVALVAPHLSARLLPDPGLAPTALIGGCLLLAADLLAQHAFAVPFPVGVVTAVVGGAFFLVLLIRTGGRRG